MKIAFFPKECMKWPLIPEDEMNNINSHIFFCKYQKASTRGSYIKPIAARGLFLLFLVSFILFACTMPACADSPPVFARLELNKSYTTRNMTVSTIDSVDLMDFDSTYVSLLSTAGDDSDLKQLQFPDFRDIRRVFSKDSATWNGNNLYIIGSLDSTVDWSLFEEYTVFTSTNLPRLHLEVPETEADVVLFKVNASTGITDIRSLVSSTEMAYLLNDPRGILAIQQFPTSWGTYGVWTPGDYDQNDLTFTFNHNEFSVSDFTLDETYAQWVSGLWPNLTSGNPPTPGEYVAYTFRYDSSTENVTSYSSWPVVIMDGYNPLVISGHPFPCTYDETSGLDLALTFTDPSDVCNISYVLIKTDETYDMRIDVNMSALEEEGAKHLSSVLSSNPFITLLKNPEENWEDISKVVNYSITRVGSPPPPPPEHPWQIAITPGYGISGYAKESGIVLIPHEDLSTLVPGKFLIYAMGLDCNNSIIALDQQCLSVIETPKAAFHAIPTYGPAPLTVQFHDDSTGEPTTWDWDFGDSSPHDYSQNPAHTYSIPGSYTVSLTVSNSFGSDTEVKLDYIVATGAPEIPHVFYGNVTMHGSPAPVDTEIEARGAGVITGIPYNPLTTTQIGYYGGPDHFDPKLIVQGEIEDGTALSFYVNGFHALCRDVNGSSGWLETYPFSSGSVTLLDLNVPEEPLGANFVGTPRSGYAPLAVQFTDISAGSPVRWSWNFGDGTGSDEENPLHAYTDSGSYTVSLTVYDASSNQDIEVKPDYITVTEPPAPPVAQFTANTTHGPAPLTVAFTDLSTGSPYLWTWNFGDGNSSNQQNPTHVYDSPGTYTVHLSVRNAGGTDTETKINYITVTEPSPRAEFVADVTSGSAPLTVAFTDLSTGSPFEWTWNFGDGDSSDQQNPVHIYDLPGEYTVALTVRNTIGTDTETKIRYISVFGTTIDADFVANVTSGPAPLTVAFTDLSSGNPDSWSWTFGDGDSADQQNPVHVYDSPGTYTVNLTVANPFGSGFISRADYITVTGGGIPPVASFAADPVQGYEALQVSFYDTSTGGPTSWYWDFGDGSNSTIENPHHLYYYGQYTVSLTVSNAAGNDTLTKQRYITVYRGGGGGGGGGGSGTIYIGTTPTTTPTTAIPTPTPATGGYIPLGGDNLTTQTVVIVSSDGGASIAISQGTRPLDGSGRPLRELGITRSAPSTFPPSPGDGCQYTGYTYLLSPDGAIFDPAASLSITPSDADWQVLTGGDLVIQRYNPATGAWEDLPTTVDHEAGTVSAFITRGGTYALFSCVAAITTPETTTTQVPTTPVYAGFPWMLVAIMGVVVLAVVIVVVYLTWIRPGAGKPPEG